MILMACPRSKSSHLSPPSESLLPQISTSHSTELLVLPLSETHFAHEMNYLLCHSEHEIRLLWGTLKILKIHGLPETF